MYLVYNIDQIHWLFNEPEKESLFIILTEGSNDLKSTDFIIFLWCDIVLSKLIRFFIDLTCMVKEINVFTASYGIQSYTFINFNVVAESTQSY